MERQILEFGKLQNPAFSFLEVWVIIELTALLDIGHSIFYIGDYMMHPEVYAAQSSPWYTAMLLLGIFTLLVVTVCSVVKAVMKRHIKKSKYQLDV